MVESLSLNLFRQLGHPENHSTKSPQTILIKLNHQQNQQEGGR